MVLPERMNKRGGSAASAAEIRCTGLEISALIPVVSISSSSAPAHAISSMVWLASTGKYWQAAPASLSAPISSRSRAPLPLPKLITGTRPPKCLAISGAVAAISFQVSHRPAETAATSSRCDLIVNRGIKLPCDGRDHGGGGRHDGCPHFLTFIHNDKPPFHGWLARDQKRTDSRAIFLDRIRAAAWPIRRREPGNGAMYVVRLGEIPSTVEAHHPHTDYLLQRSRRRSASVRSSEDETVIAF